MTNWIDIKELRKRLSFADVLRHYDVELKEGVKQHHGFCPLPLHKGKRNSPSFSANLERGIWQCFGCGEKGNVLDFAILMERANPKSGKDVRRVVSELQKRFVGKLSPIEKHNEEGRNGNDQAVINAPLDFELKGLDATHPYLSDRGFTKKTIAQFNLGYCTRGLLANRIAIPLHNVEGKLVGYAGRVVDNEVISEDIPKYKFPGRRKRKGVIYEFRKSLLLYNAHRVVAPVDNLVVVEGFASTWWLTQGGIRNVVATMGASCSAEQGKVMASLVSPSGCVWILTDGDAAGERCATDILFQVADSRFVRWSRLVDFKQPTGFSPAELQKLLWGATV